jgi:signal transduction histidine kinase
MSPWSPALRRGVDIALCMSVAVNGLAGHAVATATDSSVTAPLSLPMALLAVAVGVVLWWRRERPLLVAGALTVIVIVATVVDERGLFSWQIGAACLVAAYAIGSWSEHRVWGAVFLGTVIALVIAGAIEDGVGVAQSISFALTLFALPAAIGVAVRSHRNEVASMRARVVAAERDRDERARLAVIEERTRIARELHDVVAHHVSLIGVQAGAARLSLGGSADATAAVLASIESSSRAAVTEMRHLLGVLRDDDGDRAPQPGLAQIPELVARWREAGVAVELTVQGPIETISDGPSLAAYRIVEEALTNVAKHSHGRSAAVTVVVAHGAATVQVTDPGPGVLPAPDTAGGGRGIVGMRERARVFGGAVSAGRTPVGGFAVHAHVPDVAHG